MEWLVCSVPLALVLIREMEKKRARYILNNNRVVIHDTHNAGTTKTQRTTRYGQGYCEVDESNPNGRLLDPVGSRNLFKTVASTMMETIAKIKERRKSDGATDAELESFHHAEHHPFFNESYYFNGCDPSTNDRIITRISHRGVDGKKSYVFLLLDISISDSEKLVLSLEEDDVDAELSKPYPSSCGLSYQNVVPMRKWNVSYDGDLISDCVHPLANKKKSSKHHVKLRLTYDRETPFFWYMRDDLTVARNLAQEPWGWNFFKTCVNRTQNHGHYEDFGRLRGTIVIDNKIERTFDFGTFRDHSWDIRRWQAMDHLFILLIALREPLIIFGLEFHYLDLTLVGMPENVGGVQRYTTGYVMGKEDGKGPRMLPCSKATSINALKWNLDASNDRVPPDETVVEMYVVDPCTGKEAGIEITMHGAIRRLLYWPDFGAFKVFEDCLQFDIRNFTESEVSSRTVSGYGTRQTGYRVGAFDPTLGGCG